MGGIFKNAAGEERYVHDDELSDAVATGWAPQDDFAARNETGDTRTFSPEQLTLAQQGRTETPLEGLSQDELRSLQDQRNLEDVYGGTGQTMLAGAEGALSGATLGGSDVLLNALGASTDKRAQANPYARAAGEIGGTIATTIATGGLGGGAKGALGAALTKTPLGMLTARTGRLAETIGGVKGLVAAEALEGAVTAAGGVVSKLAIKDEEFSAKAALLDIGLGTVIGAGAGGAAGLLMKGAKAARGIAKASPGLDLENAAVKEFDDVVKSSVKQVEQADAHLGDVAKISKIGDLPDAYLKQGYVPRNVVQFMDDAAQDAVDTAVATGKGLREVGAVQRARRAIDDVIAPIGEGAGTGATKGRSMLYGPEQGLETTADIPALRKGLQSYHDSVVTLGKRIGVDAEQKMLKGGLQRAFNKINAVVDPADLAALKAARTAVDEAGSYSLKTISKLNHGEVLEKLTKLEQYHVAMEKVAGTLAVPGMATSLEEMAAKTTTKLEAMTGKSAAEIDSAYGQILEVLGVEAPKFKGPAADLHRAWVVNEAMSKGGEFSEALGDVAKKATGGSKSNTRRVVEAGARRGASFLAYSAGNAIGGPFMGSVAAGVAGSAIMKSKAVNAFLSQATGSLLNGVAVAAGMTGKAARLAGVNMGTVARNTSFSGEAPPSTESQRQTYDRITGEITALVTNPTTQQNINDQLGEVRDVNWGVGDKLEVQAMTALSYLADAIPKDPGVLQKWGMTTWKPTDSEVYGYLLKVGATVQPLNSIKRFMSGGGSPQEADAIKNVHPEIFAEFQSAFMDNLTAVRDKITGATRVRLGILFDAPIDSRLRPEFREFMKQQWVARAEEQKPLDVNAGMNPETLSPAQKLLG